MSGKIVLGRGLDALIPRHDDSTIGDATYLNLPLNIISPNPIKPITDIFLSPASGVFVRPISPDWKKFRPLLLMKKMKLICFR
jgi:hypothetical protein